ncbi:hypothetical protein ABT104_33110, partial [Streptomyces mobaraensis]|uniref:hypothetical protein n=1 Tax=Streptomyces mobaraensis TaxID=35621 RepID=UPI00331F5315
RALPFGVSNLTRSVFRSVSGSDSVSGPLLERGFAFSLSLSGDSDFIRFSAGRLHDRFASF